MTSKLEKALRKAMRETDTGLSINEMAEATGYRPTSVRRCVEAMIDTYIATWREQYRCRPTALYRVAMVPEDAPCPPRKPINTVKNKARDTRPKEAAEPKPRRTKQPKYKPQGLTQIRGPWPDWEKQ